MNHKRKRPKNSRSGCLMCKPHKANGCKGMSSKQTRQELIARESEKEQVARALDPNTSFDEFYDDYLSGFEDDTDDWDWRYISPLWPKT